MATDKRTGWLATLKAGDEVLVDSGRQYIADSIRRVERITPTGILQVDGQRFNAEGSGPHYGGWPGPCLRPVTDEARAKIARAKMLERIKGVRWAELPDETLRAVLALLASPAPSAEEPSR